MHRFFKMLIGVVLWPLAWSISIAAYQLYRSSGAGMAEPGWLGLAVPVGFIAWVLIFFLLPRPVRTYVLGHELTHALWALLMGGRVGRIKVGKEGGHVELTKTNFIITLAPYFFPFYTALVIAAYYLSSIWLDNAAHQGWWLGAIGLTWSFHITFTIHMLSQHQPDVQEHGRIFSYTVIYIMNVLVLTLLVIILGQPQFIDFGPLLADKTVEAYRVCGALIMTGGQRVIDFANGFLQES